MSDSKFTLGDLKKAQAESNKETPEIRLPLCYHTDCSALLRPLKVKDKKDMLKALESQDEQLVQKVLDRIMEQYVTYEGDVSNQTITIQERYQILTALRRAASGDETSIIHICPECEHVNKDIPYNLKNMITKSYDSEVDNVISLNDSVKVHLGPVTREEEAEMEHLIDARGIKSRSERNFLLTAALIKKVVLTKDDTTGEVEMELHDLIDFFEEMDTKQLEMITNYAKSTDHGVKLPFHFTCEKCNYENKKEEAHITLFFIM